MKKTNCSSKEAELVPGARMPVKIKTLTVLKHPMELVWITTRDRLPEIVPLLDDIESVTVHSREEKPGGIVKLVNVWKACPKLPAIVTSYLRPEMLAWNDYAEWSRRNFQCNWRMEAHFYADRIKCSGITRYEPAMGGRGTRITFVTNIELATHDLPGVPAVLEGAVSKAIEFFAAVLVPQNFRKVAHAIGGLLDTKPAHGKATSTKG
jgi:hypothetical protein